MRNYFQSFYSGGNSDIGQQQEGEVEAREFVCLFVFLKNVAISVCAIRGSSKRGVSDMEK